MLTITEAAAEKVKEILEVEGKPGWGLRIFVSGNSCCGPAYGMDIDENPREDDKVIEQNGLKVFADQETSEKLQGMLMDFNTDGEKEGFVIRSENDTPPPSCGCSSGSCH